MSLIEVTKTKLILLTSGVRSCGDVTNLVHLVGVHGSQGHLAALLARLVVHAVDAEFDVVVKGAELPGEDLLLLNVDLKVQLQLVALGNLGLHKVSIALLATLINVKLLRQLASPDHQCLALGISVPVHHLAAPGLRKCLSVHMGEELLLPAVHSGFVDHDLAGGVLVQEFLNNVERHREELGRVDDVAHLEELREVGLVLLHRRDHTFGSRSPGVLLQVHILHVEKYNQLAGSPSVLLTLIVGDLHEAFEQQDQVLLELKPRDAVHHAPHVEVGKGADQH